MDGFSSVPATKLWGLEAYDNCRGCYPRHVLRVEASYSM